MYAPDEDTRDTSVCDGDSGFLSEKDLSFAELSFGDKSNFTVITCWCYLLQVFFHTCGVCVLLLVVHTLLVTAWSDEIICL